MAWYGVEDTENQQGLHYGLHWEDAAPIRVKAKYFVEFYPASKLSIFGRVKRATRASGEAARGPAPRCRVSPRVPLARVLFMIFPKLEGL